MTAEIIDGNEVASSVLEKVKESVGDSQLRLAVVQVGENPVSATYIAKKREAASELGISFQVHTFPEDLTQEELEAEVEKIAADPATSGMIVQLPLPDSFDTEAVLNRIPEKKDVDVLSESAFEKFEKGELPILPPTVAAVDAVLRHYDIPVKGKSVVVVGRGRLVGLPVRVYFEQAGAEVIVAHSQTENLKETVLRGDIVVAGVGKPGLITGDMIKEGAVVIDAGTSVADGVSTGDVDTESVAARASLLSPVPGGVGPVTVAFLFSNLITMQQ